MAAPIAQSIDAEYYGATDKSWGVSVHNGANVVDEAMKYWRPALQSFDEDYLPEQAELTARTVDTIRNTPMLAASVRLQLDKMVGANYRMSFTPDVKHLDLKKGEAKKLRDAVERQFRNDAEDDDNVFDASGRMNFTEMIGCVGFCFYNYGESFQLSEWLQGEVNRDERPFATAFSIIDPARCATPHDKSDHRYLHAGFKVGKKGNAKGVYLLNEHPGDFIYSGMEIDNAYKYITRRTEWGRLKWLHNFSVESPGQTRGRSQFVAGLRNCRMLSKFEDSALSNAITQSLYAAVIQSADPTTAFQGLMGADPKVGIQKMMAQRMEYYDDPSRELHLNNAKVAHTFPGDELKFTTPNQSVDMFDPFETACLRHLARLVDVSYEELSGDYTKTNFSGARAGTNNSDMSRSARGAQILHRAATYMATNWFEEQAAIARIQALPGKTKRNKLQYFWNNKQALCRYKFHGPGIPHIDPMKSVEAAKMEMEMGALSLQDYLNRHYNVDVYERIDQIAEEQSYAKSKNVDILGIISREKELETASQKPEQTPQAA